MDELLPTTFRCLYCGSENELLADPSGGIDQVLVEDCVVCCRPHTVHLRIDIERGTVTVEAHPEG